MFPTLRIRIAALLCMTALALSAREPAAVKPERPAFGSLSLSVGRAHLHDDYLSLGNYRGYELGLFYERMRALPYGGGRWVMRHRLEVSAAKALNAIKNGKMIAAGVTYGYGQLYTWRLPCGLKIGSGGEIALSGGALYNARNSNNPAAAKASLTVGLSEMLSYTWRIAGFPLTLRYHMTLPVLGAYFAPAFGESYYEIFYLKNHRHIVHFGAWHNSFDISNMVTVEIPAGRSALRLGYGNGISTGRGQHRRDFHYSNAFLIGVSTRIGRETKSEKICRQAFY